MAPAHATGTTHKVISVLLRFGEFASSVIVLGLLSRISYRISDAHAHLDGRIVYTMVVAGMSIVYSVFFCPPFKSLFLSFPVDFILFVMWLIAYCLLQTVWSLLLLILSFKDDRPLTRFHASIQQRTAGRGCSARWYITYWGWYWDRYENGGCGSWKTVLAFSFIAWVLHLASGVLGAYVFHTYIRLEETKRDLKHHAEKLTR
ncbi:hypothetical protein S40293_05064 [Stachybotrys chartarum IBT 40293]|nr:hypothetical protein S40293_05064 [Stachybotrys chartarum IBT 40293]KFA78785.1 hypothetical protein S40288_08983 [Stachybotrys chartarum IBT 40288]